jgi:hypothetical protein
VAGAPAEEAGDGIVPAAEKSPDCLQRLFH